MHDYSLESRRYTRHFVLDLGRPHFLCKRIYYKALPLFNGMYCKLFKEVTVVIDVDGLEKEDFMYPSNQDLIPRRRDWPTFAQGAWRDLDGLTRSVPGKI